MAHSSAANEEYLSSPCATFHHGFARFASQAVPRRKRRMKSKESPFSKSRPRQIPFKANRRSSAAPS